ncbi:hypothetical protein C8R45DRAFT_1157636 [Mycena sanguinolenta]|nr:hypothetical protein C8R45DRAFT_1157636 [Mycena sanguinolenta]
MPRQTEIWLGNVAGCLEPTLEVLNELSDAFAPPFVQPVSNAVASLLTTLHKIFTYVQAQQDGNKIEKLFQNNKANSLLKDYNAELDQAKKIFEVGLLDIEEMKRAAQMKHKELLELISTMSDIDTTTDSSSVCLGANESMNRWGSVLTSIPLLILAWSSNSFSPLPSKPKIFYGRKTELEEIVWMLTQPSPRIAILGGGGMGKTSLARAALHHQVTLARFEQRFFVSAEPATTSVELAAMIGLHVGLNPGKDLTKAVVQYFSRKPSSLLILDNLETVWEPKH